MIDQTRRTKLVRRCLVAAWALTFLVAPAAPAAARNKSDETLTETQQRGEAYAALMRSMLAARRGEFRQAAADVRRAVELQPDSPQVRVEAADLMQRMGRRSEAIELAREALELDPAHPPTLRFLADRAAEDAMTAPQGDPERRAEAMALYERLLELEPPDEQMLGRLAALRTQAGDRQGAIQAARDLIELVPGDRRAVGTLTQLLLEVGRESEALEIVLGYLAGHPDDALLGGLADELTRKLEAWETVVRILGAESATPTLAGVAGRLYGEALLLVDDAPAATAQLERSLGEEPGDPTLRYQLARAYRRQGRLADAVALLRGLVQDSTGIPSAHARLLLAETFENQGDAGAAIEAFEEAMAVFSSQDDAAYSTLRDTIRRRMALLELDRGRPEAASRILSALEDQSHPETRELQARLAITAEDWSAARKAVHGLEELGQPGLAALLDGEILARTGRWAKAEERFDDAIRQIGPLTRVRAADICLDNDGHELAERLIRAWVAAEPELADAHYYLGYVLFRGDRFVEAETELREAFRLDPDHAPALNFLGYSLAERSDRLDEALTLIQRALDQDGWNGAYLDSLGWVYYRLGRFDDARGPLERAAREYPNDATVLEHLGDLYQKLGDLDLAVAAWERALEAGAEDEPALKEKIAGERARRSVASDPDAVQEALDRRLQSLSNPDQP